MNSPTLINRRHQSGVALVIALVLLIAVTLVGLAGIRGTTLQEQMAGNHYDREVAFQAAEAALMIGVQDFINDRSTWDGKIASNAALDCSNKACAPNPSGEIANSSWVSIPDGSAATQFTAMDSAIRPEYVVQLMGNCSVAGTGEDFTGTTDQNVAGSEAGSVLNQQGTCYRITARALDPTAGSNAERAQVLLQETWRI